MRSQFQNALRALTKKNTSNFNTRFAKEGTAPTLPRRPRSQFQSAMRAVRSKSPNLFNLEYSRATVGGLSSPRTPKSPKSPGKSRSRAKKVRRGAMTYKNAEKIKIALGKPPLHPMTRRRYNPMYAPRRVLYMNENNVKKEFDRLQSLPRYD